MNQIACPALPPVAALILCGGQGSRMGGVDKGLQAFQGAPLVVNALQRLRRQSVPPVAIHISANRHLPEYERLGVPVWPDELQGFAGPLAGMLTGLRRSPAPLLLTVPCDVPFFPLTLCEQLLHALLAQNKANVATAAVPDAQGRLHAQPVFSLLRRELADDLAAYLQGGGRRAGAWLAAQKQVLVACTTAQAPLAFANANTLAELHALQAADLPPPQEKETSA